MKTRYRTVVVALVAVLAIALCLFFLGRQSQPLYRRYVPRRRNESFYAMDINREGCIVGILNDQPKPPHPARARAVVLEPIPERWGK